MPQEDCGELTAFFPSSSLAGNLELSISSHEPSTFSREALFQGFLL